MRQRLLFPPGDVRDDLFDRPSTCDAGFQEIRLRQPRVRGCERFPRPLEPLQKMPSATEAATRSHGYSRGTILRLAKSPPELFPTHRPTRPLRRSLSWLATRLGSFASSTNTLTLGAATTTRTWNQPFGSGAGLTGCSYFPGRSALNFCHG